MKKILTVLFFNVTVILCTCLGKNLFLLFFLLFRWLPAGARDGGWKWAGNAAYVTGVTAALIFYLSGKLERRARVKDRRSPDILFRKCSVICMVVVCYSVPRVASEFLLRRFYIVLQFVPV